jgi:hypothetical protein
MKKFSSSLGWGGVTLLALSLLAANAIWISNEARTPGGGQGTLIVEWLSVLASLTLVCVVAGYLANGRPAGIFIDERYRISLARFQWAAWFIVLFSGYFTGAAWDVALGGDLPAIEPNLFALLGITTGSAVISNVIVDTKKRENSAANSADPTLLGKIDVNADSGDASWADLYLGEEEANRSTIDVSRLQKLVITMVLVVTYIEMLWTAFGEASRDYESFAMPVVGTNFVTLLGISHAAYLAYKATPKTPTQPAPG